MSAELLVYRVSCGEFNSDYKGKTIMSAVAEIDSQSVDLDPVYSKLREAHDKVAARARLWLRVKERYLRFVQEMVLLDCDMSMDGDFEIRFTATGDKQKFLQLVRCHRRHGFKPDMPAKGATSAFWIVNGFSEEFRMWFQFSSTVCHRVKIGTKMVEQDVYETHCDSIVPDEPAQLESSAVVELLPAASGDAPF